MRTNAKSPKASMVQNRTPQLLHVFILGSKYSLNKRMNLQLLFHPVPFFVLPVSTLPVQCHTQNIPGVPFYRANRFVGLCLFLFLFRYVYFVFLLFSAPTFYKRKIMIYDAFFSKFCQNSTCLSPST